MKYRIQAVDIFLGQDTPLAPYGGEPLTAQPSFSVVDLFQAGHLEQLKMG
ncbi:hypothetical protein [Serratia entomophila]|nr:hypothetical protein [Serratia entomophila]